MTKPTPVFRKTTTPSGSTLALILGIFTLIGAAGAPQDAYSSMNIHGATLQIGWAVAYKIVKWRILSSSWKKVLLLAIEAPLVLGLIAISLLLNGLAELAYLHPFTVVVIPAWGLTAYAIRAFKKA